MKTSNLFKSMVKSFFTTAFKLTLIPIILACAALITPTALAGGDNNPQIRIKVTNLNTGMPIKRMDTLMDETSFQVEVINYGADCAGQFVVTALGDPNLGAPPSALVQFVSYIIGPSVDSNSATGVPLVASIGGLDDFNDWKITASCNGAKPSQRSFDFFEFFVEKS